MISTTAMAAARTTGSVIRGLRAEMTEEPGD
jgi:hypothetical protein